MEKAAAALSLSGIERDDPAEDLDGVLRFLEAGAEPSKKHGPRVFDWDRDAGLIVASFQMQYGIDVTARDCDLHWWRFMDLLRGMGNDTPIIQAVSLRSMELPEGSDRWTQQRRAAIIEAKKRLALPAKTAAEKQARERALWGD